MDLDRTGKEMGGKRCRFLAKFGKATEGSVSQYRQGMVTFGVDQKGWGRR